MKIKLIPVFFATLFITSCGNSENSDKTSSNSDSTSTVQNGTNADADNSSFLYGIDISKYQGDEVEFFEYKNDSLTFIICKATEGDTYTDPDFTQNWQNITEKGYVGGAYHFYQSDDDPNTQAQHFLSVLKVVSQEHLPAIIDVEGGGINSSTAVNTVESDLLTFLQEIEKATGRIPILYTNHSIGNKYLTAESFAKYPLWIADYSGDDEPYLPQAWESEGWVLWQRTDSYSIDGKSNDFDLFNGTKHEFNEFLRQKPSN